MTIEDEIALLKTGNLPVDMGNNEVSNSNTVLEFGFELDEQMIKLEVEKYKLKKEIEELNSTLLDLQKGGVLAKTETKQKEVKKEEAKELESEEGSEEDDSSPASLVVLFLVVGLTVGGVWAYKNGLLSPSSSFIKGEANKIEVEHQPPSVIDDSDLKETVKNKAVEKIKNSGIVSEAEIEKAKELKEAATPAFNWMKQKATAEAEKRYEAYKESKE